MLYNSLLPWDNKSTAGIIIHFRILLYDIEVCLSNRFEICKSKSQLYLVLLLTYFWNLFPKNKSKIHQEIESENLCQQKYEERLKEEDFGDSRYGLLRKYLWNLTEYPETSLAAQVKLNRKN